MSTRPLYHDLASLVHDRATRIVKCDYISETGKDGAGKYWAGLRNVNFIAVPPQVYEFNLKSNPLPAGLKLGSSEMEEALLERGCYFNDLMGADDEIVPACTIYHPETGAELHREYCTKGEEAPPRGYKGMAGVLYFDNAGKVIAYDHGPDGEGYRGMLHNSYAFECEGESRYATDAGSYLKFLDIYAKGKVNAHLDETQQRVLAQLNSAIQLEKLAKNQRSENVLPSALAEMLVDPGLVVAP